MLAPKVGLLFPRRLLQLVHPLEPVQTRQDVGVLGGQGQPFGDGFGNGRQECRFPGR